MMSTRSFWRADMMDVQAFHHRFADRHARVERGIRILENDLHVAAHDLQFLGLEGEDILAVEMDRAAGRLDQAQHGAPDGGLSAARFAHQPQGLALADKEADVVHGLHLQLTTRCNKPARTGKYFTRLLTSTRISSEFCFEACAFCMVAVSIKGLLRASLERGHMALRAFIQPAAHQVARA